MSQLSRSYWLMSKCCLFFVGVCVCETKGRQRMVGRTDIPAFHSQVPNCQCATVMALIRTAFTVTELMFNLPRDHLFFHSIKLWRLVNMMQSVCTVNCFVNKGDVYIVTHLSLFLLLEPCDRIWQKKIHSHIGFHDQILWTVAWSVHLQTSVPIKEGPDSHTGPPAAQDVPARGTGRVTWPLSRWAAWTSADPTRSPAESRPWPDTSRQPGCACTVREEHNHRWDFKEPTETKSSEFLQNFNKIATQRALFLNVEMVQHFLIYCVL